MVSFLSSLQLWFKNLFQIKPFLFLSNCFLPTVGCLWYVIYGLSSFPFSNCLFLTHSSALDKFNFQLLYIHRQFKSVFTSNLRCSHSTICTSNRRNLNKAYKCNLKQNGFISNSYLVFVISYQSQAKVFLFLVDCSTQT